MRMIDGESMLLPTREHLHALAEGQETLKALLGDTTRTLIYLMLECGVQVFAMPKGRLAGIARQRLDISLHVEGENIIAKLEIPPDVRLKAATPASVDN
jgi:hypothetical protein